MECLAPLNTTLTNTRKGRGMGATVIDSKYDSLTAEEVRKGKALFSTLRMYYMRYTASDLLTPMKQWDDLDTARKLIFCETARAVRFL